MLTGQARLSTSTCPVAFVGHVPSCLTSSLSEACRITVAHLIKGAVFPEFRQISRNISAYHLHSDYMVTEDKTTGEVVCITNRRHAIGLCYWT